MRMRKHHKTDLVHQLARSMPIVIGLVLIWRGIWYIADGFDILFFYGHHIFSGVAGIILGLFLLYYPDHNLKEIEKL